MMWPDYTHSHTRGLIAVSGLLLRVGSRVDYADCVAFPISLENLPFESLIID